MSENKPPRYFAGPDAEHTCCWGGVVIDRTNDNPANGERVVCECRDEVVAQRIADALNAFEAAEGKTHA